MVGVKKKFFFIILLDWDCDNVLVVIVAMGNPEPLINVNNLMCNFSMKIYPF